MAHKGEARKCCSSHNSDFAGGGKQNIVNKYAVSQASEIRSKSYIYIYVCILLFFR